MASDNPLSSFFNQGEIFFHPALVQHHILRGGAARQQRQYRFQTREAESGVNVRRRNSLQNANVHEKDGQVKLEIDLPGVLAKDLLVELDQGVLRVSGERRGVAGRAGCKFERKFRLDQSSLDASRATANLSAGVLVVTVAKRTKPSLLRVVVTENKHPEELVGSDTEEEDTKKPSQVRAQDRTATKTEDTDT